MAARPAASNRSGAQNPAYGRTPLLPGLRRRIIRRSGEEMQDRQNQNDVTNRVNVEDPARVRDAVTKLN